MNVCIWEGCKREQHSRELCKNHYVQAAKRGIINDFKLKREKRTNCSIANCAGKHYARMLCKKHYRRFNLYGDPTFIPERKKMPRGECQIKDCQELKAGRGMCKFHYERFMNNRGLSADRRRWRRAENIEEVHWTHTKDGYLVGYLNSRPVRQHRVIWELHHGRKLQRFENIHHKNGIRDDNRIENLELWVRPQPTGQRPEDLVAWVLENYREEVLRQIDTRIELPL